MTDRRTDRQTDGIAMAYTRYSYAVARKKNEYRSMPQKFHDFTVAIRYDCYHSVSLHSGASLDQTKWGGQYGMVWGGVSPPKSEGKVCDTV